MQQPTQLATSAAPAEPVDTFLTHLPANLRAKFGRAQCRQLLADQSEVQRVWSRLQPVVPLSTAEGFHGDQTMHLRAPQHRGGQHSRLPPLKHQSQQKQSAIKQQDWYSVLSEQFNSNLSAGVTMPRRFGHTQETHDQAILERSPEFNNAESVYKHRRDDFAAYNEVIHVDRKFNNHWAERDRQDQHAAPRPQVVRNSAVLQQKQPSPQSAPVSILVSGGKSATSTTTAKRVTISNGNNEAMDGGGQNQLLHRANTIQQREG